MSGVRVTKWRSEVMRLSEGLRRLQQANVVGELSKRLEGCVTDDDDDCYSHDDRRSSRVIRSWKQTSATTGFEPMNLEPVTSDDELESCDRNVPAVMDSPKVYGYAKCVWSPNNNSTAHDNNVESSETKKDSSKNRDDQLEIESVWRPNNTVAEKTDKPQYKSVKLDTAAMKNPASQEIKRSSGHENADYRSNETATTPTSPSATSSGNNDTHRFPPSQSPTITLLKKARDGKMPRGAMYMDETIHDESEEVPKGAVLYDTETIYDGDEVHTDHYYVVPTKRVQSTTVRTIPQNPIKYEGIGPTTKQGIPVSLRTKVKDENVSDWYKQMYNSLHKVNFNSGGQNTIRYKKPGKQSYSSRSGYMSEPELDRDDESFRKKKYSTVGTGYQKHLNEKYLDESESNTFLPKDSYRSEYNPYLPNSDYVHTSHDVYKHQPKSITSYEPGTSSVVERELKINNKFTKKVPRSSMINSFRDGYESDTTLIRKSDQLRPLSPQEQHTWYKEIQKGGEIPLTGLRKTMPEKPKEPAIGPISTPSLSPNNGYNRNSRSSSPPPKPAPPLPHLLSSNISLAPSEFQHKFQEGQVNIHYNTPIRTLERDSNSDEYNMKQQMAMRNYYYEERRKRQLQDWADMESRKHNDNFMPAQKSPIPYNRYDHVYDYDTNQLRLSVSPSPNVMRPIESRTISRALYDFTAQSPRELPFSKGDLIYITKKIDKNWYEGEHHGMVGILPVKYVEIVPPEALKPAKKKGQEGQAKVVYTFSSQSPVELSLLKGEVVKLLRRVDENWFEGKLGSKTGIFPASYVDVIKEPSDQGHVSTSPNPARTQQNGYSKSGRSSKTTSVISQPKSPELNGIQSNQVLHIDTHTEPEPFQAMFSYKPQNEDELELLEGDTVYVMEKCDDGWYVGTSMRTGLFGTFPGNYVEKL